MTGVRGMGVKKVSGNKGVGTKSIAPFSVLIDQLRKAVEPYAVCMTAEDAHAIAAEIDRLNQWVGDLQSGMYINCAYCGHRYPPGTPAVRGKVLDAHIKRCPKHPLQKALKEIESLKKELGRR